MSNHEYLLLTQDLCPKCEIAKRMLAGPLKTLAPKIRTVHRQAHLDEFSAATASYGIQAVPALIRLSDNQVLSKLDSLHDVKNFLSQ